MDKDKKQTCGCSCGRDAATKPGIAVDIADDEKVTKKMVEEETKELNNNPRISDME